MKFSLRRLQIQSTTQQVFSFLPQVPSQREYPSHSPRPWWRFKPYTLPSLGNMGLRRDIVFASRIHVARKKDHRLCPNVQQPDCVNSVRLCFRWCLKTSLADLAFWTKILIRFARSPFTHSDLWHAAWLRVELSSSPSKVFLSHRRHVSLPFQNIFLSSRATVILLRLQRASSSSSSSTRTA